MYKNYRKLLKYVIFICISCASYNANAFVFSIFTTLYNVLRSEASAWAINVKQAAISANQVSRTTTESAKTLVAAIGTMQQNNRVVDAFVDYSASFGQTSSMQCAQMSLDNLIVQKFNLTQDLNNKELQQTFSSPSQMSEINNTSSKIKKYSKYCSDYEYKSGMCAAIAVADKMHADINISSILTKDSLAQEELQTAKDYVTRVIQPQMDSSAQCKQSSCKTSAGEELQYNSYLSMAAYSLNYKVAERNNLKE